MMALDNILGQLRPFVSKLALLFGVLAAWLALVELLLMLGQIFRPRGTDQGHAIVGACLALIGGRA